MRVLVVGARKGNIGHAVAEKLRHEGHEVIAADLYSNEDAMGLYADDEDEVIGFFDWLEIKGDLDAVVNCAGLNLLGALPDYELENFKETLNANLITNFLLLREYVRRYDGSGTRKVFLAITSDTAEIAKSHSFAYGASKAGANHFIRCAARELNQYSFDADKWVVTAIAPGRVYTRMDSLTIEDLSRERGISHKQANEMLNRNIPVKRGMTPEELANWVHFVLEKGDYATGCILRLDAGQQQG